MQSDDNRKPVELAEFLRVSHRNHLPRGAWRSIDIPETCLRLHMIASEEADLCTGGYTFRERDLYIPFKKYLERMLPLRDAVDVEATLTKLTNHRQQTDISIRCISEAGSDNGPDFMPWCFIEIKAALQRYPIRRSDICNDLRKLRECRSCYSARSYFVLLAVDPEIERISAFSCLGNIGQDIGAIEVLLGRGDSVWLMPAGSKVDGGIQVHVWAVSGINDFDKGFKRYGFTIFQGA